MSITSDIDRSIWLHTLLIALPLLCFFLCGSGSAYALESSERGLGEETPSARKGATGERLSVRDILQNNGCDNGECERRRFMVTLIHGWAGACDPELVQEPASPLGFGPFIEECLRWMGLSLEP